MIVDVICGGPGREAVVSRISGNAVAAALARLGHDVVTVDLGGVLDPAQLRPGAIVFNIVHGTYGEDGTLQSELDQLQRQYLGSTAAVSRLCMDKDATKKRLTAHDIRVPWGVKVDLGSPFGPRDLKLPHGGGYVLKPAADGSSVGLRVLANPSFILPAVEELLAELGPRPYLIEERLPGPEFTVAVIDEEGGPRALPPIAIRAEGIFDFHAKYQASTTIEEPVQDAALAQRLQTLGLAAYRACGCRDLGRVDIMATGDHDFAVLEVNTLPGMTERSLLPKAAAAAGISFDQLTERLLASVALRKNLL